MTYPQYVMNDLKVLKNAEFKITKYGYSYTDNYRMSLKLFQIASKYPQKNLEAIIDYLGYFYDDIEISEDNYRKEILHNAEYYFIQAMNDNFVCYGENVNKQVKFIELGLIDGWYRSNREFKASGYEIKYPTTIEA